MGTYRVVLVRMNLGRSVWVRSFNCDMYWPSLNVCWENSGFGLGGFNIGGVLIKRGKGLCVSLVHVLVYIYICILLRVYTYIHIYIYTCLKRSTSLLSRQNDQSSGGRRRRSPRPGHRLFGPGGALGPPRGLIRRIQNRRNRERGP